jgi:hypothetical protein
MINPPFVYDVDCEKFFAHQISIADWKGLDWGSMEKIIEIIFGFKKI